jgi:Cupin
MDVLSTVLKAVELEGAVFYNAEYSAPWSIRAPHSRYRLLTHGRVYANVEDGQRVSLAGDIVVFPHGDPHIRGNGRARLTSSRAMVH